MRIKLLKVSLLSLALFSLFLTIGCVGTETGKQTTTGPGEEQFAYWQNVELTDAATGDTFKISDFRGKPVLLESFAVWCPTCLQQQKEIKKLQAIEGDAVIHISLDTDPNEDASIVRDYVKRNAFNWYFAVSPPEVTRSLIEDFGVGFVNAPSAPVVLICEDQSTRFLPRGVKDVDKLKAEVEKGC